MLHSDSHASRGVLRVEAHAQRLTHDAFMGPARGRVRVPSVMVTR